MGSHTEQESSIPIPRKIGLIGLIGLIWLIWLIWLICNHA